MEYDDGNDVTNAGGLKEPLAVRVVAKEDVERLPGVVKEDLENRTPGLSQGSPGTQGFEERAGGSLLVTSIGGDKMRCKKWWTSWGCGKISFFCNL